jgi:leucyl aminopeptidase
MTMKFSFHTDDVTKLQTGLLGLLCFEEALQEGALYRALDKALDGLVTRVAADEQFKGKKGQTLTLHTHGRVGAQRLLLVGGGARKDFNPADLRAFGARVVKAGAQAQAKQVALALPYADAVPTGSERAAQFLVEGATLGTYRFDKYLTGDRKKPEVVEEVKLVMSADNVDASRLDAVKRGVQRAEQVAEGVALARDLINEPAAEMTPRKMAEVAQKVAKQHGLEAKVLGPKECEKLGMGMYLAVSQGSEEEPRFIHLTYRPKGKTPSKKKVALIGKGVTFDSGGLSLKPSNAMEDMKVDMSGAAAVIAAIGVLADLGVPYEVHAIAACTENMPSGKSYKLGDVLKSMNGKTVEINNTDAEGRLTLGDAITYALAEIKPDEMFDFATLTGACMVALGPHTAGVMGNDLSLVERWLAAARLAGEDMWHLPLPDKLRDQLKSEVADMRNTGDRFGGALTAGLFLKEFVGETPWVHVDIAGPASADKESGHIGKGGTGFAVSTIVEYLAGRE